MMGELRQANLERGMPTMDQAVKQLAFELRYSRGQGFSALKLIHGYGSSGTGGSIRRRVRQELQRLKDRGEVADFILGEEFTIFNPAVLRAFQRCASLRRDRDLERHNNGITVVLL